MHANDYHIMGKGGGGNKKYTYGNFEGVYDINGNLVTDPLNRGTLNLFPGEGLTIPLHFMFDVIPYYLWKNDPDDPTNLIERLTAGYDGEIPESDDCLCKE